MFTLLNRRWAEARAAEPDSGAAVVEYVGIVIFVGVLLSSLTVSYTPIGQTIISKLCQALGGECVAPSAGAPDDKPPSGPCVVSSKNFQANADVSISFVDFGGGEGMLTEKLSDGTYRVTLVDTGKLGASLSAGAVYAQLHVGNHGGELGATASVSAALQGSYGTEYTFNSAQDVAAFQKWANQKFVTDAASTVVGPAANFGSWLYNKVTGNNYKPPAPSAHYVEGGLVIDGQALAGGITAGGQASLSFGSGAGVRVDADGNTTVYNKVTLDGQAAVDLGLTDAAGGSVSVDSMMAVTVDSSGKITNVSYTGVATAEGSYNLTQMAGYPLQNAGSTGISVTASFPVTDANRADAQKMLVGMGVASMAGMVGTPVSQAVALPWIFNQAKANGDVTAQTLDVSNDDLAGAALGLEAPAVGGLSFDVGASTSTTTSTGAWYLGSNGWDRWEACS